MTLPIVCPPFNPSSPADAEVVAVGAAQTVYISNDFGKNWSKPNSIHLPPATGSVFSLAFASTKRLFIGTTLGAVFRADVAGKGWTLSRLDDAAGGQLQLKGLITEIAVDWADVNRNSVYLAFGGQGDRRRIWHFDGTRWDARSGSSSADGLLNVEHNTAVVDPEAPNNVYVGADIGVWHSANGGLSWAPLENGLPEVPVYDLQIHPTQRLLRAATHGRGVYELSLDEGPGIPVT